VDFSQLQSNIENAGYDKLADVATYLKEILANPDLANKFQRLCEEHDEAFAAYIDRIADVIVRLTKPKVPRDEAFLGYPPLTEMIRLWLTTENNILQDWVVNNIGIDWAQGINIIEAALALAGEPRS
jgi:dsDNA-binding SOS-regulon protein